jgi:hypothetical protein
MDIDFSTIINSSSSTTPSSGFEISILDNPKGVEGNRALLNRFEITFLTQLKCFLINDKIVLDTFGGDADKFINRPNVLNNIQSIAAAISVSIDQTVKSMKSDEPENVPDTEKILNANLLSINVIEGVVVAQIEVIPISVEPYSNLIFNLPIINRTEL